MLRLGTLALALLMVPVMGRAEPSGIARLTLALFDAVDAEGHFDLSAFDCTPVTKGDDSLRACRDTASGIAFLHLRDAETDNISISVEGPGPSGSRAYVGVVVADRAGFNALHSELRTLAASPPLAGAEPCGGVLRPDAGDSVAIQHPVSGQPFVLMFGRLRPADAAALEAPSGEGTVLPPVLLLSGIALTCNG